MSRAFELVYKVVVDCRNVRIDSQSINDVLRVASLNKVLLHFLRATGFKGELRRREEARLKNVVKVVERIAHTFRNLDYAFFKLVKPAICTPSDLDILVAYSDVSSAFSRLRKLGFIAEVIEPYCITMVRGASIVDLYLHPTLGGVIYLDARKLLEHRRLADFHGIEILTLETYAEALVSIAHAVYKERIYTLNDYATVKGWLSKKTLRLAEELECQQAVSLAQRIHRGIEERKHVLPYRIPLPLWVKALALKIHCDKVARSTTFNLLRRLKDRRIGKHIISKLMRKTY